MSVLIKIKIPGTIWGSYNRRLITFQPPSLPCRENHLNIYIYILYIYVCIAITLGRGMGKASEEGLLIASQSQINRTLIADFVDGFQKVLHMSASIKLYYITPLQLPCQAWRAVVLMCFLVFIVPILFKPSIQEYTILHVCCKILLRDVEGLFSGLQTNRGSIDAVFVNRRCKICKVIHTLS